MELTILGSGTCVPSLRRSSPGLLLKVQEKVIILDFGAGALRRMLEVGLGYHDIDYFCFTHIHPDHIADIIPFLFCCNYGEEVRVKNLQIIGGPGFSTFFNNLISVFGHWLEPLNYKRTVHEFINNIREDQEIKITTKPLNHSPQSIGYRIENSDGKSLVYSGDTAYCDNIVELAKNASLLVLESSFPDDRQPEWHLTPFLAGRIASEAYCERLVLTHFYPPCDEINIIEECRKAYKGEIIVAEDLMKIMIK